MRTFARMTWFGLFGFLVCMVATWTGMPGGADLKAVTIACAIGALAIFAGGVFGLVTHHDYTPGQEAARDLHTAKWLNHQIVENIKETEALLTRAEALSVELTSTGYDCAMAARYEHDQATLDDLRMSFDGTSKRIQEGVRQAPFTLKEMSGRIFEAGRVVDWGSEAEVLIRQAHARSGGKTWIAGPPVAGQYMLAGEVEPQRVLIVTLQVLKDRKRRLERAYDELDYARQMAPRGLRALSDHLTRR